MIIRRFTLSLSTIVLASIAATAAHAENPYLHDDYVRFVEWFPGEYDNHEQLRQEEREKAEPPRERIDHIVAPVKITGLGDQVYFVQQTRSADRASIDRLRAYALQEDVDRSAIVMTVYSFKDEAAAKDAHRTPQKLAALTLEDFTTVPGCEIFWQWHGAHFEGTMMQDACSYVSERFGERIIVNDELRLTQDQLWIHDVAVDDDGKSVFGDSKRSKNVFRKVR